MWLPWPALLVTAGWEAWGTMYCSRPATDGERASQSVYEEPQGEFLINLVTLERRK